MNTVTSPGNRAADHAAVHHGERNASPAQPRYGLSHVIRAPLTMRRGLQAALRRAPRPGRCPGRRSFGYEAGWRTPASSTRCSRCSRVMGGRSRRGEARPRIPGMWAGAGTTRRRWWALGARTPWSRTRRLRGRGAIKVTTRCLRDRASRTGRSRHPASRLPPPASRGIRPCLDSRTRWRLRRCRRSSRHRDCSGIAPASPRASVHNANTPYLATRSLYSVTAMHAVDRVAPAREDRHGVATRPNSGRRLFEIAKVINDENE